MSRRMPIAPMTLPSRSRRLLALSVVGMTSPLALRGFRRTLRVTPRSTTYRRAATNSCVAWGEMNRDSDCSISSSGRNLSSSEHASLTWRIFPSRSDTNTGSGAFLIRLSAYARALSNSRMSRRMPMAPITFPFGPRRAEALRVVGMPSPPALPGFRGAFRVTARSTTAPSAAEGRGIEARGDDLAARTARVQDDIPHHTALHYFPQCRPEFASFLATDEARQGLLQHLILTEPEQLGNRVVRLQNLAFKIGDENWIRGVGDDDVGIQRAARFDAGPAAELDPARVRREFRWSGHLGTSLRTATCGDFKGLPLRVRCIPRVGHWSTTLVDRSVKQSLDALIDEEEGEGQISATAPAPVTS